MFVLPASQYQETRFRKAIDKFSEKVSSYMKIMTTKNECFEKLEKI